MDSAQEAIGKIRAEGKNSGPMEIMVLDLASLKSVKDFATLFQIQYKSVSAPIIYYVNYSINSVLGHWTCSF
jgi:hypothetical protein